MKSLLKSLILLLLVFSLALALLACTRQDKNQEDEGWIQGDVEIDTSNSSRYAHPKEDDESDSVPQSGDRVTLPFVPLG